MDKYKEKSKEYFNKHAKDYAESRCGEFTKPMYQEIINRVLSKNPKKILDLGCGPGYFLKELKSIYESEGKDLEFYGLDIADEMIKMANNELNGEVDLKVGDCEDIPWDDNSFDIVICNASFHHYPNPKNTLLEVKRVLKDNGTFILGDPTFSFIKRNITNLFIKYSDNGEYRIYNQKEIEKLLKEAGFNPYDFKLLKNKFFISADVIK